MGTAGHLILGRFYGILGETCPLLMYPRFHRWSWRILRVACLSRQEAPSGTYLSLWLFDFQGTLANAKGAVLMGQTEEGLNLTRLNPHHQAIA